MTKYIPVEGSEKKFVRLDSDYSLGGYNVFTGRPERRGYYVYARYVERDDIMESCVLGEGFKQLVVELKRNNKKAEKQAEEYLLAHEQELVETLKRISKK